ncbi:MAG TPA: acetyl-CoA carboxylase biotin carboxyl carrier protein subunit [Rhizomicrobium sp.]|jgi:acetyl-CoA carboxylase biotin carboxyl carrier protein|nr:acetyl-CoA carboxylase biotin carboxyl carrier protein subunit [Rhizomicrobium sp.]
MSKENIDAEAIRALAALLTETNLTDIEIEENGKRIRVSRRKSAVVTAAPMHVAPAEPAPKREGPAPGAVTSPMVGTVYVAAEPGASAFVKVGDTVKEGDTLLIVEAMKTMNPILAPRGGTISEICVSDAQPIEFGQTLLILS